MAQNAGTEHHKKAAEYHRLAATHHEAASKHHEVGNYERAAHEAYLAHGHHLDAEYHMHEAARHYAHDFVHGFRPQ